MTPEDIATTRHVVALITALGDDTDPAKAFNAYLFEGMTPKEFMTVVLALGCWARIAAEMLAKEIGLSLEEFLSIGSVRLEADDD